LKDDGFFENSQFMRLEEYRLVLERYYRYITNLTLTGGEATLHPELEQIIDLTRSMGLKVSMITNGILVEKNLSAIRKLDDLNITLDATDYDSFSRNRGGTEKQWARIMEGLQLLKENKIDFTISYLATSKNIVELHQLIAFADRFHPTTLRLNSINPHGPDTGLVLMKSDPTVMKTVEAIMERNDYSYNIKMPFVFDPDHPYFRKKICVYPWHGVYVNDRWDVAYCCQLAHEADIGNLLKGYDFNSPEMVKWRQRLLDLKLPLDCLFCHRRFKGDYTKFIAKKRLWKKLDPFV
jgi:MoaA/NifB/PqqE/SkfB family radical SAM enzyme